jgi:diadenosine tetraphosphate (Ap4A) HIT family hydrolase
MSFELHPALAKKTHVLNLSLCTVLLEDEVHYPWLILVPRRPGLSTLMNVPLEEQGKLMQEMSLAQHVLTNMFQPTQINVAAIGNKTPQLHIHVIARFTNDPAWPHTVWDHPIKAPYSPEQKKHLLETLQSNFSKELIL